MRRMKRLLPLLLGLGAALLLLTSCASKSNSSKPKVELILKVPTLAMNCVSDPKITEAYTILTAAAHDFSANYQEAQVTIKVVKFDLAEEAAYIPQCFDTKAAADILYEDYFNMNTYVHTGRVVPLDDIITPAWRQDVNPAYWQMSQFEGKTYMLPYLSRQNVIGYHKSLLRQAGLGKYVSDDENIHNWSLTEWKEILSTLAQKLPANTYAMAMFAKNEHVETVCLMSRMEK